MKTTKNDSTAEIKPSTWWSDTKSLAQWMHDNYETYAVLVGWDTQTSTKVVFDELPEKNKEVMLFMAKSIQDELLPKALQQQRESDIQAFEEMLIDEVEYWQNGKNGKDIHATVDQYANRRNQLRAELRNKLQEMK